MLKIGILGVGKIGSILYNMLTTDLNFDVTLADKNPQQNVISVDATNTEELENFVSTQDAIINAMPFTMNKFVAQSCAKNGVNYFDFSEDVETTNYIKCLADDRLIAPNTVMIPQCGLAPGAINIIGANLIKKFDNVKSLEMRVGALPKHANNEMQYYLSWSSAGLVNEYIKPCNALWKGRHINTVPMDGLEHIVLDGNNYEAFNTSGGVATMCETYVDTIQDLNYKTIRYPGHCDHMKFVLHDLGMADHPELLIKIMENKVPNTIQDVVIIYANAIGTINGTLQQRSYLKHIYHDSNVTAIQRSTAAGMAAVIEMWANNKFESGFIKQETIELNSFLSTKWGHKLYNT